MKCGDQSLLLWRRCFGAVPQTPAGFMLKTRIRSRGDQHLAMAMSFGEIAGFWCTSASDLSLVYVTPEKPSDSATAVLALSTKKLLVIVDSAPRVELTADVDVTVDGEKYRLSAEGPEAAKLAIAAAAANKRFAVAVQVNDKIAYSKSFDVNGSTAAIGALLKGCDIHAEEASKTED